MSAKYLIHKKTTPASGALSRTEFTRYGSSDRDGGQSQLSVVSLPRNHLYRTPIRIGNRRPLGAGGFVLRAQIDHGGDLTDQLDLEALFHWAQDDPLNEPAQDLERFAPGFGVGEG